MTEQSKVFVIISKYFDRKYQEMNELQAFELMT